MGVTILGAPTPLYDYIVSGPFPIRTAVWTSAANFRDGYISGPWPNRSDGGTQPRDLWVYNSFGAGGSQGQGWFKGVQATFTSSVGPGVVNDGLSGISLMPVTDATGLDAAYLTPSWRRVNWFSWSMATSAGAALTVQSGIVFDKQANVPVVNRWPYAPAPGFGGGFGIIGDGAGGWQYQSWEIDTGVPPNPILETVALGAFITDPEDWNTYEFVLISAAGGRNASLELWINDALVLTRAWGAPGVLEVLGPFAGSDFFRYTPVVQAGPGGGTLWFGDWTHRMGRFTRGGRELLK